jgi:chromosome segregation ATPase
LTKTTYTEEEIKQILHALFVEKKKVKELEQQIKTQEPAIASNKSSSEDVVRLQMMLEALKNKYQANKSAEEECVALREQQKTLKKMLLDAQEEADKHRQEQKIWNQQLKEKDATIRLQESNIENLSKKQEESDVIFSEASSYRIKLEEIEKNLSETYVENDRLKQKIEKLILTIQEKEKRINDLQQFEYSFKKATLLKKELEEKLEREKEANHPLLQEQEQYIRELAENKQHTDQLERVINFLRERAEEAQLEAKQLQEEFLLSREAIVNLTEQLKASCSEIEDLGKQLQTEQRIKNEALEELLCIQDQFEELKKLIINFQTEMVQKDQQISEQIQNLSVYESEKLLLTQLLEEKRQGLAAIENEVNLIKQTLGRALRESKELETRHQETVQEKVIAINKAFQLQQQVEKQRNEIHLLKENHTESSENEKIALEEISNLKKYFELEKQTLETSLQQKDLSINKFSEKLSVLEREKIQLEEHLFTQKSANDELDSRLKIAQQHLAKKVKETSILNEELENQKQTIKELQNGFAQSKLKMNELQTHLDSQTQLEKHLKEQLQESLRNAEAQANKWEEKYFRMYERLQEVENQNKNLKKYEEKHQQLQNILGNLGKVMESNQTGYSTPTGNPSIEVQNEEKQNLDPTSQSSIPSESKTISTWENSKTAPASEQASPEIFTNPRPSTPYKKTLFD